MLHFIHRYSPWRLTTTSRKRDDGLWERFEVRHCRKCGWTQTRPSGMVWHRRPSKATDA